MEYGYVTVTFNFFFCRQTAPIRYVTKENDLFVFHSARQIVDLFYVTVRQIHLQCYVTVPKVLIYYGMYFGHVVVWLTGRTRKYRSKWKSSSNVRPKFATTTKFLFSSVLF